MEERGHDGRGASPDWGGEEGREGRGLTGKVERGAEVAGRVPRSLAGALGRGLRANVWSGSITDEIASTRLGRTTCSGR